MLGFVRESIDFVVRRCERRATEPFAKPQRERRQAANALLLGARAKNLHIVC